MDANPNIQDILPAATQAVIAQGINEEFKSTLKLPKGMNRHLVARGVDLIIIDKLTPEQVQKKMGLVPSEVKYITEVVAEFRAWEAASAAMKAAEKPAEEPKS